MKQKIIAIFLMTFAALFFNQKADAQTKKTNETIAVDAASIEKLIQTQLEKQSFVGGSIAVMHKGKIVFAKGYGKSSLETGKKVDTETIFDAGSVTKQFTAAAILLLAEDGKLSATDKVSKYYPELTGAGAITLLDLMNHTAGYQDYAALDYPDRKSLSAAVTPEKIIHAYAMRPLDFAPSTNWSYSNTNYMILGRVVERVSGESLRDFFARRIFKPLAMRNTFYPPYTNDNRLATGYTSFALSEPQAIAADARWAFAAGGLLSTATDLLKWNLALMDGKILKPESLKLMTEARKLADGSDSGYGCGLFVSVDENGVESWEHGGATSGFLAENLMIPATHSAIVVLSNADFVLPGAGLFGKLKSALSADQIARRENKPASKKRAVGETVPPRVTGLTAAEAARKMFAEMQAGKLDRANLSDGFNFFLDEEKLRKASAKLKSFGAPTAVNLIGAAERGGMEATFIEIVFPNTSLKVSMFRSTDGKIQQFLIRK
jgi:CubicO group peptidase (beta-lactamase class C family)